MYLLKPDKPAGSSSFKHNSGKDYEDVSKNLFLREFENSLTSDYQDRPLPIPREGAGGVSEYFSFENNGHRSEELPNLEKTINAKERRPAVLSKVLKERLKENMETFKKDGASQKYSGLDHQSETNKSSNIEIIMDYLNTIKLLKTQVESLEAKQNEHVENIKTLSEANMRLRKENKDLKQRVNELENEKSDDVAQKELRENQQLMSFQKDKLIEELGSQIMNLKKDKKCLEEVVDELLQEKSDLEGHLSTLRKPDRVREAGASEDRSQIEQLTKLTMEQGKLICELLKKKDFKKD